MDCATQIGRLDFLSAILAALSVALVLGGIFSYFNINIKSKKVAAEIAKETAQQQAEYHTNDYIQKNLLVIITSYEFFTTDSVSPLLADRIAENQKDD